jgi:preprotein translocase subunit SecA
MNSWPQLSRQDPAIPGFRPEKHVPKKEFLETCFHRARLYFSPLIKVVNFVTSKRFLKRIGKHSGELEHLDNDDLCNQIIALHHELRMQGLNDILIARSFALIREISGRTLGKRHYETQMIGGCLLLRGMILEMQTGEGKTLTATLAAGTAAMAGIPVHVLTVNDYLTDRDKEEMEPVYRALDLSVGLVVHGMSDDERKQAYDKDVVYCTGKELVFDYLRDRIALGSRRHNLRHQVEAIFGSKGCYHRLMMRGLHFAIVDEADSVLIDEARTPLIISGKGGGKYEQLFLQQALEIVADLEKGIDFHINDAERRVTLKPEGKENVRALTEELGPLWSGAIRREEIIVQALNAMHLFHLDEHYILRDEKIEIIDLLTGRVSEGRSWERGLHQLIELKEGCELSQQHGTVAKISYQRFFQRYLHLSGMTGTASEVSNELWQVYALRVAAVPPNRPCIRESWKTRILPDSDRKWDAISARIKELTDKGRAVLVGTGSVAASEKGSNILSQTGLEFQVLNAKQDKEEAEVVALAGNSRKVTVATSMAGRGTDIKLADYVRENGGLHVILSERYDAARVDRQLAGRCARQGDPGSFEQILSLDDAEFTATFAKLLSRVALALGVEQNAGRQVALIALWWEQKRRERRSYLERKATQKHDLQQGELLSISGLSE